MGPIAAGDEPTVAGGETPGARSTASAREIEFFEKRIRPLLVRRCYECHADQLEEQSGSLVLDNQAGWLRDGDEGPAMIPLIQFQAKSTGHFGRLSELSFPRHLARAG